VSLAILFYYIYGYYYALFLGISVAIDAVITVLAFFSWYILSVLGAQRNGGPAAELNNL
jgi:hypothetical protein